ncbi:MAG: hypothetical protein M1831_001930 [Alyxoria varia]|nr:MAG: hypothetical protein M1831_001930 [Alyxoria varia]
MGSQPELSTFILGDTNEPTVTLTFKHKGKSQAVAVPQSWNMSQLAPFVEKHLDIPVANQKLLVSQPIGLVKPGLDKSSRTVTDLVGKSIMLIGSSSKAISNLKRADAKTKKERRAEKHNKLDEPQKTSLHPWFKSTYERMLIRLDWVFQMFVDRGVLPITPDRVLHDDIGNWYFRRTHPDDLEEGEIAEDHIPVRRFGLLTRFGSSPRERLESLIGTGTIPRFCCIHTPSSGCHCWRDFMMQWRCFARFHAEMELSIAKAELSKDAMNPSKQMTVDAVSRQYRFFMGEWDDDNCYVELSVQLKYMIEDLAILERYHTDPQNSKGEVYREVVSFFQAHEICIYIAEREAFGGEFNCSCGECVYSTDKPSAYPVIEPATEPAREPAPSNIDTVADYDDKEEKEGRDKEDEEVTPFDLDRFLGDLLDEDTYTLYHFGVDVSGGEMELEWVADTCEDDLADEMVIDETEMPQAKPLKVSSIRSLDNFDEAANLEYAKAVAKDIWDDVQRTL